MDIRRGDIIMVHFYGNGNIQNGYRPAVIVQNNIGNRFSPTTIVAPITSEIKKTNLPTHEVIKREDTNGLRFDSMALCEQLITINKSDINKKIGKITNENTMRNISKACSISLDIALA